MDSDFGLRLSLLWQRVVLAVEQFQTNDPEPDDPFRGLYVSDDQASQLLQPPPVNRWRVGLCSLELPDPLSRLGALAASFELSPLEIDILMVAMAPDLDPRFERLFGYLHDDLTRRRASIGLVLELAGRWSSDPLARSCLNPSSNLVRNRLLIVNDEDRPFLTRPLRVPDRVVAHSLGDDSPDSALSEILIDSEPPFGELAEGAARLLGTQARVYFRETGDAGACGIAAQSLRLAGANGPLVVDFSLGPADQTRELARVVMRECKLSGRGLVTVGTDGLEPSVIRVLTASDVMLAMVGAGPWNPEWSSSAVLTVDAALPSAVEQDQIWSSQLAGCRANPVVTPAGFRLGPVRIRRAVEAAQAASAFEDVPVQSRHLVAGARAQNSVGLAKLARRIVPVATWDQIVLEPHTRCQLDQVISRVANRHQVLDEWGLRRGGGRGEGIVAMFAGGSGTGKTMAAEIVAAELGLEMYVIDLSSVIDKYIGETEKNLDRIFSEAEGVNGILFFDEADALFGKRTDVSDSRDRHANAEVAYLLQRLESFDGLGVLATNLRSNIDEAFARRLSVVIDFSEPGPLQRRALWAALGSNVPFCSDVDFDFCADAFALTGGNIRNVIVSAAYMGAANSQHVTMEHIVRATEIEYLKLGRLCTEAEFGPYLELLTQNTEKQ